MIGNVGACSRLIVVAVVLMVCVGIHAAPVKSSRTTSTSTEPTTDSPASSVEEHTAGFYGWMKAHASKARVFEIAQPSSVVFHQRSKRTSIDEEDTHEDDSDEENIFEDIFEDDSDEENIFEDDSDEEYNNCEEGNDECIEKDVPFSRAEKTLPTFNSGTRVSRPPPPIVEKSWLERVVDAFGSNCDDVFDEIIGTNCQTESIPVRGEMQKPLPSSGRDRSRSPHPTVAQQSRSDENRLRSVARGVLAGTSSRNRDRSSGKSNEPMDVTESRRGGGQNGPVETLYVEKDEIVRKDLEEELNEMD